MELTASIGDEKFITNMLIPMSLGAFGSTTALRLVGLFIFVMFSNNIIKTLFHQPRPTWINHNTSIVCPSSSFAWPSGMKMVLY